MFSIKDNVMRLTRGDDATLSVTLKIGSSEYTMVTGDTLTLTVRDGTGAFATLIFSVTSTSNTINIGHADTAGKEIGQYSADIQLIKSDGKIFTVWPTDDMFTNRQLTSDSNWKNFWLVPEVTLPT